MSSSNYTKPDIKTNFSSIPVYLFYLIAIALYGFGIYSFYDYFVTPSSEQFLKLILLGAGLVALPFALIIFVIYLVISFFLSLIVLWIMSKIAKEILLFVSITFPALFFGLFMFFFLATGFPGFVLMALIPGLLLLFVVYKFNALRRAGRFVEFSAKLILDEKALLGLPVIFGIFTLITGFFMVFGGWEITKLFATASSGSSGQSLSAAGNVVTLIFEYFYLIIYFGGTYILNSYVISYSTDWYRGLDPSMKTARKDVNAVLPIILKYAFATATINMIYKVLARLIATGRSSSTPASGTRRGGSSDGLNITPWVLIGWIGYILMSIFGMLWAFVNYFTLVAVVQNRQNLTTSIKDSARTMWDSFLDIVVSDVGFGLAMMILFFVNLFTWFSAGFGIGYFLFTNQSDPLLFGFIIGIIFLILSFYPYNIITMPMRSSYNTFLYCYAKDSLEGFSKPSRLEPELRDNLALIQSKQARKRRMRDPSQYI